MTEVVSFGDSNSSIRILLYSPNLSGHPQVYCRVIADILRKHGATIYIATADIDDWANRWPDIGALANCASVHVISARSFSVTGTGYLRAEDLRRLQDELRIDATLFIEAEYFRPEFVRISKGEARRLLGYNAGIFGETTRWYPGEEFYSGKKIGILDGSPRKKLGTLKRMLLSPWTIDRFFFEDYLIGQRLLDAVIVKDERLAARYPGHVHWLPEIYRVFDSTESDGEKREYDSTMPAISRYLEGHNPDNVLLFFGAGAWYKGYDHFVQLLLRDQSSIGVHVGSGIRHQRGKQFIGEPELGARKLISEGRLFATNRYVQGERLIRDVFRCARRFVSTHRLTVSSGTMLQGLELGLPVLAPASGLVGYRTRSFGLGRTYKYDDIEDLLQQWLSFRREPLAEYGDPIGAFMRNFGPVKIESLLKKTVLIGTVSR